MLNSVAAIIIDDRGRFLLQLRDERALLYANKWTLFSGRIRLQETPKDALRRELGTVDLFGTKIGEGPSMLRPYKLFWDDDMGSSHSVGLIYWARKECLNPVGSVDVVALDDAVENFEQQLAEIPLK